MYVKELDQEVFIRFVAFSSKKVEGFYRFEDRLQISPVADDCPKAQYLFGSHPFIVEYKFPKPELEHVRKVLETGLSQSSDRIPDHFALMDLTDVIRDEIVALLCLLVDPWLTTMTSAFKQHWVRDLKGDPSSVYAQESYICDLRKDGDDFRPVEVARIDEENANKHFNSFAHDLTPQQKLPTSMTTLLGAYFVLPDEDRESFQRSLALFHQSMRCRSISTSLSFMGLVSAIENMIVYEYRDQKAKRCTECGQPKYKVRQRFLNFMTTYASQAPDYRKIADKMYQTRSGIGHAGKLLADDVVGRVTSAEDGTEAFFAKTGVQVAARISLVNWLSQAGGKARSS